VPYDNGRRHPTAMAMETDEKATATNGHGTMVIRVWREPVAERALRIRMTFEGDTPGEPTTVVAVDADQVVATVQNWLASLA
jgi:hypothetical protein